MTLPAPPSETPETCSHELWEMETACADGLCPLCLQRRLREAEALFRKATGYTIADYKQMQQEVRDETHATRSR